MNKIKMITDYEVEGTWVKVNSDGIADHKCRKCGANHVLVPREGHFNSKYWDLQRNDGLYLVSCPEGCSVVDADKTMKDYMKVSYWCKDGKASYKHELDLLKIEDAWIDRTGKIIPVEWQGHSEYADSIGADEFSLEQKGWVKIARLKIIFLNYRKHITKKQKNAVQTLLLTHGKNVPDEYL